MSRLTQWLRQRPTSPAGAGPPPAGDARRPGVVLHHGVLLDTGDPIFSPRIRQAIADGSYEYREADLAGQLIRPGDVVVELGAGCGYTSCAIALLNRASRIVSVDANPELLPLIRRHHAMNGVTAEIYIEFLSSEPGAQDFYLYPNFWSSNARPRGDARQVSIPRRSFAGRMDEWKPDFMLIDIEGGEVELLRDNDLPKSLRSIVLEFHPWIYGPAETKALFDRLSEQDFAPVLEISGQTVFAFRNLRLAAPAG